MEDFINYTEALALKELGFDGDCFAIWSGFDEKNFSVTDTIRLYSSGFRINGTQSSTFYINDFNSRRVSAPTFSQAFKFFREKYELHSYIERLTSGAFIYKIDWFEEDIHNKIVWECKSYSFEETELECLKKLIELVKNEQRRLQTNNNNT